MTIMEKSEFLDYYIMIYVFLDSFHPLEHVLLRQWSFRTFGCLWIFMQILQPVNLE